MRKINKLTILSLILITFLSCNSFLYKNDTSNKNIVGTWVLDKKQINYPELTFNNDHTCIFSSRGDTLYRFKYRLNENELILEDILGTKKTNKILELTDRKLVFQSLWENKEKQVYNKKVSN